MEHEKGERLLPVNPLPVGVAEDEELAVGLETQRTVELLRTDIHGVNGQRYGKPQGLPPENALLQQGTTDAHPA